MPYKVTTMRQFKGLSQNLALTSGSPEYALELGNAIPSIAGLAKLRIPTTLSQPPTDTALGTATKGPDQFAMYNGVSKSVLAFFGTDIYVISLDDFQPQHFDRNAAYAGIAPWSVVMGNDRAFMQNGTSLPLKYTGGPAFLPWGVEKAQIPLLGTPVGSGITLTKGRKYRVAYQRSLTSDVGTASDPSAETTTLTDQTQPVQIPGTPIGSPDPTIDSALLYATLDGGDDYFFHSEVFGPFPIFVNDSTPDEGLDQTRRAPLINDVPPRAKYLTSWGGRIFMANLIDESRKWIAYTGYNRIFVGRPEETCPFGNRIKLDVGADEISGFGVIEAGVIAFDNSNQMYMFRGQPEDIVIDAPVEYSLFLKRLPFTIGCAAHFTIQSCPYGLIWLSPCFDVYLYNGQNNPRSLTEGAEPIMRSINRNFMDQSRAVYWQYKGRDWYVLGIPVEGSTQLNRILVFDLEQNEEKNVGTFPLDIGPFDSMAIVEMQNGEEKLVIGQGGSLKELTITASTKSGIEQNITATTGTLGGFYQTGYLGNDSPEVENFIRWVRITTDQPGAVRVKTRLIRDDVTKPDIIEFQQPGLDGKLAINRKGRLRSYEFRFDDSDVSQNILQVVETAIPVAQR